MGITSCNVCYAICISHYQPRCVPWRGCAPPTKVPLGVYGGDVYMHVSVTHVRAVPRESNPGPIHRAQIWGHTGEAYVVQTSA